MRNEFQNREDAGRRLARRLTGFHTGDVVVLGLPRGGVPVAAEVAAALNAPLDVIVVRKLGVPFQPEVAMGAIGERGVRVLDGELIAALGITPAQIDQVEEKERATLAHRSALLHSGSEGVDLTGHTALIVDDGIATGATTSAACRVARALGAARVIVAAPVGGPDAVHRVRDADEVLCLIQPRDFRAVGEHYRDFDQTSEAEVVEHLDNARRRMAGEHR
ncbi:phosphoribosyltransferase [Mycetocola miduiensis]|uniref:Putative phosphoribosyl transferase n=1 Tax=Mycetocola miduiensis TaxID=995034 RepID=A0A1I4ZX30_9MICO|nr:phosphoribosyltransferase family protein [Mycetocola miduiensis]SFN54768.1 putative phosphoribosyl transferase [Mycetocola miduiensis]